MNWYLSGATSRDTAAQIKDAAMLAEIALTTWLDNDREMCYVQPESNEFVEFPPMIGPTVQKDLYWPVRHRFRFRTYFGGKCLGPREYYIEVEERLM